MSRVTLHRPWLDLDLGARMRVLSWSLNRPGFVTARRIVWREVRDADLTPTLDVRAWLAAALDARGAGDAVALLTSRDVSTFTQAEAAAGGCAALAVATVGLSNAERVGGRVGPGARAGTVNVAVRIGHGLARGALVEAMSIAAQARTLAVMEAGLALPGGIATGTGTDCIAVAAPPGAEAYAGLHTDVGEAVGAAILRAVRDGVAAWTAARAERGCDA